MYQSLMLLRLEIKRAMKSLPQLIAGALVIFAIMGLIIVFTVISENEGTVTKKMSVDLAANNNTIIETVGMDVLSNMEIAENNLNISMVESEDEGIKRFENGETDALIIFPDNYIASVDRGENLPAKVYLRNSGYSFTVSLIAKLCGVAGDLLAAAESSSYAAGDLCNEFEIRQYKSEILEDVDVINARMILSREDNFSKLTIYGENNVPIAMEYACAVLVMITLLWGISCGTMIKSDSPVLVKKLEANLLPLSKQIFFKLVALICLMGTMFLILCVAVIAAFLLKPDVFEMIGITDVWQIVMLIPMSIPTVICASAIVLFAFTAASNQIGGILLLSLGTVAMGYASGCLMPAVYLPMTIRNSFGLWPTYYMKQQAINAISGKPDFACMMMIMLFAVAFYAASAALMKYRYRRM